MPSVLRQPDLRPAPGGDVPERPALACIELSSIARGMRMCDDMAKKAPIRVLESVTVCPGKYIVVIGGSVEDVSESYQVGLSVGGPAVVDRLMLPNAHPQLFPAIEAVTNVKDIRSLGVVETFAVASAILGADVACKRAAVELIELRLARGLGGKAFFTLTGELADVEVSVAAAADALGMQSGMLLRTEVIPRPHPEMVRWIL